MFEIEVAQWREFQRRFADGEFGNCRFGQAFCNHFKTYKMTNLDNESLIYNAITKEDALIEIVKRFFFA